MKEGFKKAFKVIRNIFLWWAIVTASVVLAKGMISVSASIYNWIYK